MLIRTIAYCQCGACSGLPQLYKLTPFLMASCSDTPIQILEKQIASYMDDYTLKNDN